MGRPSDKALFDRVADRSTFQDAADGMTPALVHASATVQLTPNAVMLWVSAKNQMHPCSPINSEPATK